MRVTMAPNGHGCVLGVLSPEGVEGLRLAADLRVDLLRGSGEGRHVGHVVKTVIGNRRLLRMPTRAS